MGMEKVIQVGLIGYGFSGRAFQAPVLTSVPNLKLAKVVERSSSKSKERYPWVEIVRDMNDLFQDPAIELVVVATPSTNHYEVTKAALLAGKHVVVEKPFTATTAEADELVALAQERGLVLSVFHNRRWDGDFLTIKQMLANGWLGKLAECEFHWDGYAPRPGGGWRETNEPGAGVFYDLGVHFLDQALCLFGMPKTIRGDIRIQREGGKIDDYFDVQLGYSDGLKVILKSSKLVREVGPRYILHGTNGSFVKHGIDPQERALIEGRTPAEPGWGAEPESQWGKINTEYNGLRVIGKVETIRGSYADYFQNVYDAIVGQAELIVKPEQARDAIRLIELAQQSSAEGRTLEVVR